MMRRGGLALLLSALAVVAVAPAFNVLGQDTAVEDPGLGAIWERAMQEPLAALPLESNTTFQPALLRLDRLSAGFDESQRILGDRASGPLLRSIAPGAGELRGLSTHAAVVGAFLDDLPALRAGRATFAQQVNAAVAMLEIRSILDRTQPAVQDYPAALAAWIAADAWWRSLDRYQLAPDVPDAPTPGSPVPGQPDPNGPDPQTFVPLVPPPTVRIEGNLWPDGLMRVRLTDVPAGANLVLPWRVLALPSGTQTLTEHIPFTQSLGPATAGLVGSETELAQAAFEIGPIPFELRANGPREASANATVQYEVTWSSPVAVNRSVGITTTAGGQAVAMDGARFSLVVPASGSLRVVVQGRPGNPWASDEVAFTLAAPTKSATDAASLSASRQGQAWWLLAAVLLLLVIVALALWWRSARQRGDPGSPAAGAGPLRKALTALQAWWSKPDSSVAQDFRNGARVLAQAGRIEPSATHETVAKGWEEQGMRPAVAQRLADGYERTVYARDANAPAAYWHERRRPP